MNVLALMFAVVIIQCASGRPPLPPLPSKDGCYLTSEEVEVFRVEGEAVILHFPMFRRALHLRHIVLTSAEFSITKNNGTEERQVEGGRVQQRDEQLWFLPAQAADSGEYICTYRNESYCISGNISLQVFQSSSVDLEKLSYPVPAQVGEELKLRCPFLSQFNRTDRPVQWFKDSSLIPLQMSESGSSLQDRDKLVIPSVRTSHSGLYSCQLLVSINQQQFRVSRVFLLQVEDSNPTISMPAYPDLSEFQSIITTTPHAPMIQPPVIVLPSNGTVYESAHGSALELSCLVLTGCQTADSTAVSWLINGLSVESSYLDNRALQGGRRVLQVSTDCQIELRLIIVGITEEDEQMEIKCVARNNGGTQEVVTLLQLEDSTSTWLAVCVVAVCCFLAVVSVFLCILCRPKRERKADYFLARQNSAFSFT